MGWKTDAAGQGHRVDRGGGWRTRHTQAEAQKITDAGEELLDQGLQENSRGLSLPLKSGRADRA